MFVRPKSQWKLGRETETAGARLWIAASVCIDDYLGPDGKPDREKLAERVWAVLEQDAQLLDLSAFPEGSRATADDELRRYVPVLRKLVSRVAVPVMITTSLAETAERVAGLGADVIRDPSGLRRDPALIRVLKPTDAAILAGSGAGGPPPLGEASEDSVTTTLRQLNSALGRVSAVELDPRRVAVEPLFGTRRPRADSAYLLRHLSALHKLRRPVVVGLSGAGFLVDSVRVQGNDRDAAEAAGTALAVASGVQVLRTAKPALARRAAFVAEQLFDPEDDDE